jgi:mRNA interferase YafQ
MRTIEHTSQFRKDYKRERKGQHAKVVDALLQAAVHDLQRDIPLAASLKDHDLSGQWKDHRDCHLKPDLVLIYAKFGDDRLVLTRIGSHSELFG